MPDTIAANISLWEENVFPEKQLSILSESCIRHNPCSC